MLRARTVSARTWVRCGLAVLVLSMFAGGVARADIVGDTVVIQYLFPDSGTLFGLSSTGVVTASGVSLNLFGNQQVTVFGTDVQMVGINAAGSFFQPATFNGVSIQDLTNPSAFTGFSVDAASNVVGFNISDVSLSGGLLFINYQNLQTPFNSLAQVDFTSTAAVPEPNSLALLAAGLAALLGLGLKKAMVA
jgi:hypothetical protein